jgi:hypothetical protein
MNRVIWSVGVMVGIGLLSVVPVRAHHAFAAEFDANRPVKLTGTLVKVEWVNPHSWFHFDVKRADGEVERWMFEGGGPAGLARRGFTKDYEGLTPGAELVIEGYLSKGLPRRANARTMTFVDGRAMFIGSSGTGAPRDGADPTEGR